MTGRYDDNFIDRVREAVDIAQVIGDYVTLKRRGMGSFIGLCPFHSEKTPSFNVSSDRGMFKCFGCGRGGNVFTFLMEMEGLSFLEALRSLAERVGMEMPDSFSSADAQKNRTERDQLFNAMERAVRWFHSRLTGESTSASTSSTPRLGVLSPEAQKAREYLNRRGIDERIIRLYRLGWAETGWDELCSAATRSGISGAVLERAGLAYRKHDSSGYVDRFRARVIFPILNLSGKAVAFGARRIDGITPDSDDAKYVNSSETLIYRKGQHLYGLYTSRDAIRRAGFAYLVEGYTDLLALVQAGVTNGVASLGTSLTHEQARLVGRFARRAHVVYDSDSAGITAAARACDILLQNGLEPRVILLPEGSDPDSLLREQGVEKLVEALNRHRSMIEFRLEVSGFSHQMGQSERIETVRGILESIRGVTDPLRREVLVEELAGLTGLGRTTLDKALSTMKASMPMLETADSMKLSLTAEQTVERDLIEALVAHPEIAPDTVQRLRPEHFTAPLLREVFLHLEKSFLQNEIFDAGQLLDKLEAPALRAFVADSALRGSETTTQQTQLTVEGCLKRLKLREILQKKREVELEISTAANSGKPFTESMKRLVELQKEINQLSKS